MGSVGAESGGEAISAAERLTDRQKACLRLAGQGFTNKEIGRQLAISPETVKQHINASLKLMAVDSRRSAARLLMDFELAAQPDHPPERANPPAQLAQLVHLQAAGVGRAWRRRLGPFGWLIPVHRGAINDLSLIQRVVLLVLLPFAVMLITVGALSSFETLLRLLTKSTG